MHVHCYHGVDVDETSVFCFGMSVASACTRMVHSQSPNQLKNIEKHTARKPVTRTVAKTKHL